MIPFENMYPLTTLEYLAARSFDADLPEGADYTRSAAHVQQIMSSHPVAYCFLDPPRTLPPDVTVNLTGIFHITNIVTRKSIPVQCILVGAAERSIALHPATCRIEGSIHRRSASLVSPYTTEATLENRFA